MEITSPAAQAALLDDLDRAAHHAATVQTWERIRAQSKAAARFESLKIVRRISGKAQRKAEARRLRALRDFRRTARAEGAARRALDAARLMPEAAWSRADEPALLTVWEAARAVAGAVARNLGITLQTAEDAAQDAAVWLVGTTVPVRTLADATALAKTIAVRRVLKAAGVRRRERAVADPMTALEAVEAAPEAEPSADLATALDALEGTASALERCFLQALRAALALDPDHPYKAQAAAIKAAARKAGVTTRTMRYTAQAFHARALAAVRGTR